MNTPVREGETIEGSRTMRKRPYPVLKCSSAPHDCHGHVLAAHVANCDKSELAAALAP